MKNFQKNLIALFLFALLSTQFGFAQPQSTDNLRYEVKVMNPPNTVTKESLNSSSNLIELDRFNKAAWIKKYYSVMVSIRQNGKLKKMEQANADLNPTLLDFINSADVGTLVNAKIHYLPENKLKNNEAKYMDLVFQLPPDHSAEFMDGQEQMNQYLKKNVIQKISSADLETSTLVAVQFTVSAVGKISEVNILESSKNEKIDELLLTTLKKMSNWKPAAYDNGKKVAQDFILTIGNLESCLINKYQVPQD